MGSHGEEPADLEEVKSTYGTLLEESSFGDSDFAGDEGALSDGERGFFDMGFEKDTKWGFEEEGRLYFPAWYMTMITSWSTFLGALDASLLDVSVVSIADYFDINLSLAQWVIIMYMLCEASFFPLGGRLGDRYSKKYLYQGGMFAFVCASAFCAFVPNFGTLLLGRALQGLSVSIMGPLNLAIIAYFTTKEDRGKAIGNNMLCLGLGLSMGPPIGGFFTGTFGWRSVFFVNVPIGILGLIVVQKYMPHTPSRPDIKLDLVGVVLFMLSISGLLLTASTYSYDTTIFGLFAAFSTIVGTALIAWLLTQPDPLIPIKVLKNLVVAVCVACAFLLFFCVPLVRYLLPVYLQEGLGWDPEETGLFQMVQPVSFIIAGPISGYMSGVGICTVRVQTTAGLALFVGGSFLLAYVMPEIWMMGIAVCAMAMGIQIFLVPNVRYLMANCGEENMGVTSALTSTARSVSYPIGICVCTLLLSIKLPKAGVVIEFDPNPDAQAVLEYTAACAYVIRAFQVPVLVAIALTAFIRPVTKRYIRHMPIPTKDDDDVELSDIH